MKIHREKRRRASVTFYNYYKTVYRKKLTSLILHGLLNFNLTVILNLIHIYRELFDVPLSLTRHETWFRLKVNGCEGNRIFFYEELLAVGGFRLRCHTWCKLGTLFILIKIVVFLINIYIQYIFTILKKYIGRHFLFSNFFWWIHLATICDVIGALQCCNRFMKISSLIFFINNDHA